VLFQADEAGNLPLLAVGTSAEPTTAGQAGGRQGGSVTVLVGGDRQVTDFDLAGGTLAVVVTSATALPELAIVDQASGAVTPRTSFGAAFGTEVTVVAPERFVVMLGDSTEVDAWLMRPAGARPGHRHPTLVNIHGGPFSQYGNKFFDDFQLQVAAGYCVVYSNPRGSSGYSEAFGRSIRGPLAAEAPGSGWGGVDFEDLMAVVDAAQARFDCVDAERLGVLGGSYGGYLTSWTVGHTDRFKAALSERAVNNLLTMTWTSDIGVWFNGGYIGVSHLDDPSEYLRQSPITNVRDISTPMLILHSEDDWRCPVSQAEELWVGLHLLDRDVEFVRFPGEGHELSRSGAPRHRIERAELILDWFERKL
jgi:dipeptidyl aminopeptidase/acylaminoacyl peptidase